MYDLATKYAFYLSDDSEKAKNAFVLLHELEVYVNGAIIQSTRINRTRKLIDKNIRIARNNRRKTQRQYLKNKKDFSLTRLGCDYHFYFICLGQVGKLLKQLSVLLDDGDLRNEYLKFRRKFDQDIRNHLEHIDERAVGRIRGQDIGHISDFVNFPGDSLSFNGKKYPVNKEKLAELKTIYEEVIKILHDNHASKDEEFLRWEEREKQTWAVIKRAVKEYKSMNHK